LANGPFNNNMVFVTELIYRVGGFTDSVKSDWYRMVETRQINRLLRLPEVASKFVVYE
jgi:hypothetical protein